jgi:hypothetical protein
MHFRNATESQALPKAQLFIAFCLATISKKSKRASPFKTSTIRKTSSKSKPPLAAPYENNYSHKACENHCSQPTIKAKGAWC